MNTETCELTMNKLDEVSAGGKCVSVETTMRMKEGTLTLGYVTCGDGLVLPYGTWTPNK